MGKPNNRRAVHTEHVLFECWITDINFDNTRLFRAPTVLDGSGDHRRLPHEVGLSDLRAGDLIVAIDIEAVGQRATVISTLQFWHVLEAEGGEVRVLVNNLVGASGDGEYVYDRLAGMVGMPPSSPGTKS